MKKLLSVLITVLMLMQMFTVTVLAGTAPAEVYWTKEYPGEVYFSFVSGVESYSFVLKKDNQEVFETDCDFKHYDRNVGAYWSFRNEILENGSGTYIAGVGAMPNGFGQAYYTATDRYIYRKPTTSLSKVTNIKYDQKNQVITWNGVAGAVEYDICFCYSLDDGKTFWEATRYGLYGDDGCYFNFWDEPEMELEWLEEEYEWIAEDAGVSVDELVRAIQIIAYPKELNDANPSYSDYVTFDGGIVETPGEEEVTELGKLQWESEIGSFSFMPASDKDRYYIKLYKNDIEVDGTWYFTEPVQHITGVKYDNFIYTMVDEGSGEYRFSVCSVNEDYSFNNDIVYSEPYTYNKKTTVAKATNLSYKDNTLSWTNTDGNVSSYAIAYYLTYDEKEYHQLLVESSTGNNIYVDQSDFDYFNSTINSWHNSNSNKYDKEKAKMVAAVYSVPSNRNTKEMSKSDYCLLMGKKEIVQVDRSSITNSKYKDAAKFAYDLGFIKNVYENPTANITKGEFCEIVVKMLGAEDVAKTLNDTNLHYDDVETGTDLNGYIKYIENMGLLNTAGSSFGVATEMPYIQILKVFVSMLGYDSEIVQNYGGYPTGYMVIAAQNNITKGLSLAQTDYVTKEQLALLVFNAMNSKTIKVDSYTINGPVYKISEESLLFKLGYSKIDGVGYADSTSLTIDNGTLKNSDNLTGAEVTALELENCDYDALALNGKKTTYYVIDGKAMCALPKFGGSVVINNGDAETSNRNVTLTIKADGYTKYKIGDGAYFPITPTLSYRLAETDGIQYVYVTFANDDETQTLNVSDSIILNNKHKITYKANGRVFKTVEVGCGKSVPAMTEIPSFEGYRFDGWDTQTPSVMPDYDIVVNAKMTPITTVTGKVTVKGTPVEGAKVWIGEYWYAQTDAKGEFSFDMERGHQTATIKYNNMSKAVFCEFKDATLDLGEITLEAESTEIKVTEESITSVSGAENIFNEEDKEFAKTEGNVVAVKVNVKPAEENTNITEKETETNYKVETLVDIVITKVKSGAETSETEITETNNLLEFKFVIPAESIGKASYVILREHKGEVDMLTTVPNAEGEYIVINQDVIVVYAKKFSTYGLAAKEVVSAEKTETGVSLTINLNEQVVENGALMIVKAYNKRGVQIASKSIPVTSAYSDIVTLECKEATGYKLLFFGGLENIKPVYAVIDGSL